MAYIGWGRPNRVGGEIRSVRPHRSTRWKLEPRFAPGSKWSFPTVIVNLVTFWTVTEKLEFLSNCFGRSHFVRIRPTKVFLSFGTLNQGTHPSSAISKSASLDSYRGLTLSLSLSLFPLASQQSIYSVSPAQPLPVELITSTHSRHDDRRHEAPVEVSTNRGMFTR